MTKDYRDKYDDYLWEEHGEFIEDVGCQKCGSYDKRDIHHIVYKSEEGKHPEIDNPRNLIILCRECHDWYEADKSRREHLIKERNLDQLFNLNKQL